MPHHLHPPLSTHAPPSYLSSHPLAVGTSCSGYTQCSPSQPNSTHSSPSSNSPSPPYPIFPPLHFPSFSLPFSPWSRRPFRRHRCKFRVRHLWRPLPIDGRQLLTLLNNAGHRMDAEQNRLCRIIVRPPSPPVGRRDADYAARAVTGAGVTNAPENLPPATI